MESNVKFKQIAIMRETDEYYGEILGLSEDGDVWQVVRDGDWNWKKIDMPMDWQKELDYELNLTHNLATVILRGASPAYLKRMHDSSVKLAHAAFMLHPELREE